MVAMVDQMDALAKGETLGLGNILTVERETLGLRMLAERKTIGRGSIIMAEVETLGLRMSAELMTIGLGFHKTEEHEVIGLSNLFPAVVMAIGHRMEREAQEREGMSDAGNDPGDGGSYSGTSYPDEPPFPSPPPSWGQRGQ